MKRAAMLYCADIDAPRFKVLKQRDQLPFIDDPEELEGSTGWGEYSLDDAFRLRLMLDLVGGEGKELVHGGLPPSYAEKVVSNAMMVGREEFPKHPLLLESPNDWWLGVVIFEGDLGDGKMMRFSRWYAGEIAQVARWIEERSEAEDCRPVRTSLVNVTRAAKFVESRARERGVWDEATLGKLGSEVF